MNLRQLLRQLKHNARNATWSTTGNALLGTVASVSAVPDAEADLRALRLPALLIEPRAFDTHAEHPRLGTLTARLTLIVENLGDPLGRGAVLGHAQSNGDSAGAGLADLFTELWTALDRPGRDAGYAIHARRTSSRDARFIRGAVARKVGTLARLDTAIEVRLFDEASFPPALAFAVADAGSGNATLTFTPPPSRFDRVGVHIRRLAGSTPPATATDGAAVYTGAASPQTDSPGAGSFAYACWGAYAAYHEDDANAPTNADTYTPDAARLTATVTVT